jgi:hypothetical protein
MASLLGAGNPSRALLGPSVISPASVVESLAGGHTSGAERALPKLVRAAGAPGSKMLISLADGLIGRGRASNVTRSEPKYMHTVTTLLASTHWHMEEDSHYRVVRLRRSRIPFASIAEITAANDAVIQRILPRHRNAGIVVDMRGAPSRNDPAFEAAMRGLRTTLETRFARTAVLLATRVGMLQVNRITREDGTSSFATTDEEAAERFARGEPP